VINGKPVLRSPLHHQRSKLNLLLPFSRRILDERRLLKDKDVQGEKKIKAKIKHE
jgi:hypothetical protein